jgi:hypothetical protein
LRKGPLKVEEKIERRRAWIESIASTIRIYSRSNRRPELKPFSKPVSVMVDKRRQEKAELDEQYGSHLLIALQKPKFKKSTKRMVIDSSLAKNR